MITVRYFAAAKSALGVGEDRAEAGSSIGEVLADAASRASDAAADAVLARCSFLLNGQATTDRHLVLTDGDTLDVLPPFAGG